MAQTTNGYILRNADGTAAVESIITTMTTNNDANIYPLISLRLKSTHLHALIEINHISVVCTSTAAYRWGIFLNPTVVGTALAFTGITNSAIESDAVSVNTTTITGGTLLHSGYNQAQNEGATSLDFPSKLNPGSKIDGTADIIVLAFKRVTGDSESFYGSVSWNEFV